VIDAKRQRPGVRVVTSAGLIVLICAGTVGRAGAQGPSTVPAAPTPWPPTERPTTVPLAQEFSPTEITVAIGVAAAGVFLLAAGDTVFDPPKPSMGAPDPGSVDARLTRWLYRPAGGRLWAGVPDTVGIAVIPTIPVLMYGIDTVALLRTGHPWLREGDLNPQHHLVAYVEAVGWTLLATDVIKYLVGRPRPYTEGALDHPELRRHSSEDNLSFFSGHSALDFAVGAFVAADVSDGLLRGPLAGSAPVPRFVLGRLLPALVGYGVPTLIGISRVVDQQHWPSDVVVGGLTGALIAHLVYAIHFDDEGLPRARHALPVSPLVGSGPSGTAWTGLALTGTF
jgi:membrane-associated phospholipid phosphatase